MFAGQFSKKIKVREFLHNKYNHLILENNPRDTSHISIVDSKESLIFRGKFLKREKTSEGAIVSVCTDEEIKNANLFCFGGQGFDTAKHHSALLKSIEAQTYSNSSGDLLLKGIRPISYHSRYNNIERFSELVKYSMNYKPAYSQFYSDKFKKFDYSYFSPDIENLCLKYIIPKLNKTSLSADQIELILYSYSAGGREIMMIQNCLTAIFIKEYKLSFEEIEHIFSKIKSVSQAFAVYIPDDDRPKFCKKIYFSLDDCVPKMPKKFLKSCEELPNLIDEDYVTIRYGQKNKDIYYIYGPLYPNTSLDDSGHSLNRYVELAKNRLKFTDKFLLHSSLSIQKPGDFRTR